MTKIAKTVHMAALLALAVGSVMAAAVYTYKCSKCGLIQTFDKSQGSDYIKCPKDGAMMVRQK